MRTGILFTSFALLSFIVLGHEGGHGTPLKEWTLAANGKSIKGDFVKYEKQSVWLIDENGEIHQFDFYEFSPNDRKYILAKQQRIDSFNRKEQNDVVDRSLVISKRSLAIAGSLLMLLSLIQYFRLKRNLYLICGTMGTMVITLIACGDDDKEITPSGIPGNDITFMQSIFEKFSGVTTSSDNTYFYVSSNGLPDHNMMVGITNWQQQVPIDHNYTGSNSWAIPIQPEFSGDPLSTQTNLLKGAVAIAANGIPIFNPLNNRGEDANAIGELDQWGGHCGRADDYHYHLPPTHLQSAVGTGNPIAYAVDGFPVYGQTTDQLDEYLGKQNSDGSYQYHTVDQYPYFIAGMRGMVTLDPNTTAPENQVIPQATTQGVRPALTPLQGAEITGFQSTGTNAYSLVYVLNSETYTINYNWDNNGLYTFEFVSQDGTTTETYQR